MATMMEVIEEAAIQKEEAVVKDEVHDRVMKELQTEWLQDRCRHTDQRMVMFGIRSSQISALVMYLIKRGYSHNA